MSHTFVERDGREARVSLGVHACRFGSYLLNIIRELTGGGVGTGEKKKKATFEYCVLQEGSGQEKNGGGARRKAVS